MTISLTLTAGLDRSLAWEAGGSVRYLVAELTGPEIQAGKAPALNLALAIDISFSWAGGRMEVARRAALALINGLTKRDLLSIIAYSETDALLLDHRSMDRAGRAAARRTIASLAPRGNANLYAGWLRASEQVAMAMAAAPLSSHRVLMLSGGAVAADAAELAPVLDHVAFLRGHGVVTSVLSLSDDGDDDEFLIDVAAAGGGHLHVGPSQAENGRVMVQALRASGPTELDCVTLRIIVPANLQAQVVGAWAHVALPGVIQVMLGEILPEEIKRVVLRLHCPSGAPGASILLGVSASAHLPGADGAVQAEPVEVKLGLVQSPANRHQPRHADLSLLVLEAWEADTRRLALRMGRKGDAGGGRRYLELEMGRMQRFAQGIPGCEALVEKMMPLLQTIGQCMASGGAGEVKTTSLHHGYSSQR